MKRLVSILKEAPMDNLTVGISGRLLSSINCVEVEIDAAGDCYFVVNRQRFRVGVQFTVEKEKSDASHL